MGTLDSHNPATGELVGTVETIEPEDVRAVVADVAAVQPVWGELALADRGRYMARASSVLLEEMDEVARLLSSEQGKPLVESIAMELIPTIDALRWCAREGPRILADERIPQPQAFTKAKRASFVYEPLGVVGVIAPWNYPWSIPLGEMAFALMAGNGVVLKPASLTPLLGERIREVLERAGLPPGLVRVVHGGGRIGEALCEDEGIAKVFFTGSVDVGRHVGEVCARNLKGSVLELGGKDPQIVCADADLEMAVSGCLWGGFANAGQSCSGIERTYVVREVADEFVERLVAGARTLSPGDPLSYDTEIGPMTSEEQFETVCELVDDAVAQGATMRCGGPVEPATVAGNGSGGRLSGKFYGATVLTDVTDDMRIMREEVFGPVVPVVTVESEEEAVERANDSEFGLGASVWTKDRQKGDRIGRRLEAGTVWINDHLFSHGTCQCSWGGVKNSGIGRSHSKFGFYECVSIKHLSYEPGFAKSFWWHPYDRDLGQALRSSARALYGTGAARLGAVREGGRSLVKVGARVLRGD